MKKIMGILLLFGLITTHKSEGQQKKQVADWSYYQSIIDYNLFRPLGWRPRGQVSISFNAFDIVVSTYLEGSAAWIINHNLECLAVQVRVGSLVFGICQSCFSLVNNCLGVQPYSLS